MSRRGAGAGGGGGGGLKSGGLSSADRSDGNSRVLLPPSEDTKDAQEIPAKAALWTARVAQR